MTADIRNLALFYIPADTWTILHAGQGSRTDHMEWSRRGEVSCERNMPLPQIIIEPRFLGAGIRSLT